MGKSTGESQATSGQGHDGRFYAALLLFGLAMLCHTFQPEIRKALAFIARHSGQIWACLIAAGVAALSIAFAFRRNQHIEETEEEFVTAPSEGSVFLGQEIPSGRDFHLRADLRTMHTQLAGTTGAGKTSSFVLPCIAADMEEGRGCIIIDGKADAELLNQLYAKAVQTGRKNDFLIFSLAKPHISSTFNPFSQGTPDQITERVFSAFPASNDYYRKVQFTALRTIVALLVRRGQTPLVGVIRECLRNKETLQGWTQGLSDPNLLVDVNALLAESDDSFQEKYSGLVTDLGFYSQGESLPLQRPLSRNHPDRSPEAKENLLFPATHDAARWETGK